ncbi:MAG: DUF3553 domain-containing protein [Gammaproteobacteria bacterium]|nr:DUF3553 domain-containing protein [Gammaproteobacteria bacterium]
MHRFGGKCEIDQEETEFMKEGTVIKHPSTDWGKGIVLENAINNTIKVRFERVGLKTLSLEYVKPIILENESLVTEDELERIKGKERIYFDEKFIDIFNDIKSKYPKHLIFIHNGCYFDILFEDAEECSKLFNHKIYELSEGVPRTGVPIKTKKIWQDLQQLQRPYIIVSQLESGERPHRKISEIYP